MLTMQSKSSRMDKITAEISKITNWMVRDALKMPLLTIIMMASGKTTSLKATESNHFRVSLGIKDNSRMENGTDLENLFYSTLKILSICKETSLMELLKDLAGSMIDLIKLFTRESLKTENNTEEENGKVLKEIHMKVPVFYIEGEFV